MQIKSSILGTGKTITLAGPMNFYRALTPDTASSLYFSNHSVDPTTRLLITGNITTNVGGANQGTIYLTGTSGFANQGAQSDNVLSGSINETGGNLRLMKYGLGSWTLSGTNNFRGRIWAMGGTLKLDFSAAGAPASDIAWNGVATPGDITMEATNLYLQGAAGVSNTQRAYNLGFAAGSQITVAGGSGGTMALNFTASGSGWGRSNQSNNPGGTLNISLGSGGAFNAGNNNAHLINNALTHYNGTVADITFNSFSGAVSTAAHRLGLTRRQQQRHRPSRLRQQL